MDTVTFSQEDASRLRARAAAAESSYHRLFEHVTDAILVFDQAAHCHDANPAATALLGYTREELLTLRVSDVVADRAVRKSADPGLLLGERSWQGELDLHCKDGRLVPVDARVTVTEAPTGSLSTWVVRDLTERRQLAMLQRLREQLEAVFQGIAEGIIVQDPTGRMLYANDAAAQLIGYPSGHALVATPAAEILSKFDLMDEAGQPFPLDQLPGQRVLRGEPVAEALLCYRMRATGEQRWAVVKATPASAADGTLWFVVYDLHDIT